MSVVDYLLNSLIKKLQKTQKARKYKKKAKRKPAKRPRRSVKRESIRRKRKTISRKKGKSKRLAKRNSRKKKKIKSLPKKKKVACRPKTKPKIAKKVKKGAAKVSGSKGLLKEVCIGEITHFFSRIQVVVLKMTAGSLSIGDQIHIKGRGTDFTQKAGSLQIESIDVKIARKGQLVGLKVNKIAKVGSRVYKMTGKS